MVQNDLKILIQRCDKLGDVILTFPVIDKLKQAFPFAKIDFLTSEVGAELARNNPNINKIYISSEKANLPEYLKLIFKLRKQRYDAYLSLWYRNPFVWLGLLAGIPLRIGEQSLLFNRRIMRFQQSFFRHQIEENLDFLHFFNLPAEKGIRPISTSKAAQVKIKDLLAKSFESRKPVLLIFNGTGGSNLPIPETTVLNFLELCTEYNVILYYGDPLQFKELTKIKKKHILNITTRLSLDELIALVDSVDYYIGPDTGPTHIASFQGKPLLFFQATKHNFPTRWGPKSNVFRILREEYRYSKKDPYDISAADLKWLTGKRLFNELTSLTRMEPYSPEEKEVYILKNTYRVIYCVFSKKEFSDIYPVYKQFRKAGLMIFMFYFDKKRWRYSLFRLFRKILKKNVFFVQMKEKQTLVFGLTRWLILYFASGFRPIFIFSILNKELSVKHLLKFYSLSWTVKQL